MDYWVFLETVFPYTAQCLVFSGTCYPSVTEFAEFPRFYVETDLGS